MIRSGDRPGRRAPLARRAPSVAMSDTSTNTNMNTNTNTNMNTSTGTGTSDTPGEQPSAERLLRIYLDDHWAASGAAVARAARMVDSNAESPWAGPVTRLSEHLADDDRALGRIRASLAIDSGGWKRRASLMGERIGRLTPNGRVAGYSPLSRVIELEMLTAHLAASRLLWQTLRRLDDARLSAVDLAGLELRTEVQLGSLHEMHDRAVDVALSR